MHKSTLKARYQADLDSGHWLPDEAQSRSIVTLEKLAVELCTVRPAKPKMLSKFLSRFMAPERRPVKGLYLWGGVGRGKTYLMDLFFECLPIENKTRTHFHRFMHAVHSELKTLKLVQDPLDIVADRFAAEARVICFDEFFVSDITDAMILAGLLRRLFENGVTMVATSNVAPDGLYKNGLQRANFLPAIELIKRHMTVQEMDGGVDYRLRTLEMAEIYHYPLDAEADRILLDTFEKLCVEPAESDAVLNVEGRTIRTRWGGNGIVWFDFYEICDGPRSQNDYIEISRCYNTVLVSCLPQMGLYTDDLARRFISLVDEFYDRRVKLIISAETGIDQLYSGGNLDFEFERTRSRLREMQTHDYLALQHLT